MVEMHNAALWPLHGRTLAAGLAIIVLVARLPGSWTPGATLVLALLCIFVGWSFLWHRYSTINWAAAYIAPAFFVEGVLLLVASLRGALSFEKRRPADWIGYLI